MEEGTDFQTFALILSAKGPVENLAGTWGPMGYAKVLPFLKESPMYLVELLPQTLLQPADPDEDHSAKNTTLELRVASILSSPAFPNLAGRV